MQLGTPTTRGPSGGGAGSHPVDVGGGDASAGVGSAGVASASAPSAPSGASAGVAGVADASAPSGASVGVGAAGVADAERPRSAAAAVQLLEPGRPAADDSPSMPWRDDDSCPPGPGALPAAQQQPQRASSPPEGYVLLTCGSAGGAKASDAPEPSEAW